MRRLLPTLCLLSACPGGIAVPASHVELHSAVDVVRLDGLTLGQPMSTRVEISNTGPDSIALTASVSAPFTVSPTEDTLSAEGAIGLVVSITAESYDRQVGALEVSTADGSQLSLEVVATTSSDQDGDGSVATEAGGDDCDDADAAIGPGQSEVYYDGIDQDCDGSDATDADEDGWNAEAVGGSDCDDEDASIYPGALETRGDGVDQDCDGLDDTGLVLVDSGDSAAR